MATVLRFTEHIWRMPIHWRLWVAVLFLTNMGALLFVPRPEALVVLLGLFAGAVFQNVIFARLGFVRLLGLGHFHWFAMVAWLVVRLDSISGETWFHHWVLAVVIACALSLVIDTIDVVRYLLGDRGPTIVVRREAA